MVLTILLMNMMQLNVSTLCQPYVNYNCITCILCPGSRGGCPDRPVGGTYLRSVPGHRQIWLHTVCTLTKGLSKHRLIFGGRAFNIPCIHFKRCLTFFNRDILLALPPLKKIFKIMPFSQKKLLLKDFGSPTWQFSWVFPPQ